MQTKKMSLANIKGKLSRAEMKNIMAGSGIPCQMTIAQVIVIVEVANIVSL